MLQNNIKNIKLVNKIFNDRVKQIQQVSVKSNREVLTDISTQSNRLQVFNNSSREKSSRKYTIKNSHIGQSSFHTDPKLTRKIEPQQYKTVQPLNLR